MFPLCTKLKYSNRLQKALLGQKPDLVYTYLQQQKIFSFWKIFQVSSLKFWGGVNTAHIFFHHPRTNYRSVISFPHSLNLNLLLVKMPPLQASSESDMTPQSRCKILQFVGRSENLKRLWKYYYYRTKIVEYERGCAPHRE